MVGLLDREWLIMVLREVKGGRVMMERVSVERERIMGDEKVKR